MNLLWLQIWLFSCFYFACRLESRLLLLEAVKQNFGFRLSCDLFCMHLLQECFHEKDFLNHRYHAKRCLYLCVIEKNLRCSKFICKVSWSTFQDEARKPVLHVYPGSSTNLPFFHIVGALEADTPTSGIFVIMLPSHFFNFHWCSNRNCRPSWILYKNNPDCGFFVQCFKVECINEKQCPGIYKRWYDCFTYVLVLWN